MRRSSLFIAIFAFGFLSSVGYLALAGSDQMDHATHGGHETPSKSAVVLPTEVGQSAFAAIAEIVEILGSNPETDWSKVNISRLREHLVDMKLLTTEAIATQIIEDDTITFVVQAAGRALSAVQMMVPAHAEELNKSTPWEVVSQPIEGGIRMKMRTQSKVEQLKLASLGFFGVMATGSHHQKHHLAMAKGESHGH